MNAILEAIEKKYTPDAERIDKIDGIGVDFKNWRFNLRPSNTEPLIRFNMETRGDKELLKEKENEVIELVKSLN